MTDIIIIFFLVLLLYNIYMQFTVNIKTILEYIRLIWSSYLVVCITDAIVFHYFYL